MKSIILFFFIVSLAIASTAYASSIALSPASIQLAPEAEEYPFMLINPNNFEMEYEITVSDPEIQVEETGGAIAPLSRKQLAFSAPGLGSDAYIVISSKSQDTVSPAITLKILAIPRNTTQAQQGLFLDTESRPETPKTPLLPEAPQQKETDYTLFLLIVIAALLTAIALPGPKKYVRTGHTGQMLRMFIKKLLH